MEQHELQAAIETIHQRHQSSTDGAVATYIPELSKVDPDGFGICIATADGRVFETGDSCRPFTIQSISKPFTYGIALEEFGDHGSPNVWVLNRAATRSIPSSCRTARTALTTR